MLGDARQAMAASRVAPAQGSGGGAPPRRRRRRARKKGGGRRAVARVGAGGAGAGDRPPPSLDVAKEADDAIAGVNADDEARYMFGVDDSAGGHARGLHRASWRKDD